MVLAACFRIPIFVFPFSCDADATVGWGCRPPLPPRLGSIFVFGMFAYFPKQLRLRGGGGVICRPNDAALVHVSEGQYRSRCRKMFEELSRSMRGANNRKLSMPPLLALRCLCVFLRMGYERCFKRVSPSQPPFGPAILSPVLVGRCPQNHRHRPQPRPDGVQSRHQDGAIGRRRELDRY